MTLLLDKLASQEKEFFNSQLLSPVLKNAPIRVRMNGIVMNFSVQPKGLEGWGIFRPISSKVVKFVREPTMGEKAEYLNLFPVLRLILARRNNEGKWYGIPAHQADRRFKITGLVPVFMVEDAQIFNVVKTRFDGEFCWFDGIDEGHNPRVAPYLRDSLLKEQPIKDVLFGGLSQEEKDAYHIAFNDQIENKKDGTEERIKGALKHAGAQYRSYIERGDTYTIEYVVDGNRHSSVVKKDDLGVVSAGICLSGQDRVFDLQSLVSVVREGTSQHRIVRV